MYDSMYKCPKELFHSQLSDCIASFIEYKVNVGKCKPDSFIPTLRRFDKHCASLILDEVCLTQDMVSTFLEGKNVLNSTKVRIEGVLRSFSKYMYTVLGVNNVYILPYVVKRKGKTFIPYVFSYEEITKLFSAADEYKLKMNNKKTWNLVNCARCIIKLLYCTGMRVSEACNLYVQEVDLANRIIHINRAKNGNRRIVTISASLLQEIKRYQQLSKEGRLSGVYFFDSGSALKDGLIHPTVIYKYFRRYLNAAGIEHKGVGFGPRLHDLRVTFAVHSLKQLTQNAEDVNAAIYYLSTYMGHRSIKDTQSYLWLSRDLLDETVARIDEYTDFISDIFDEKVAELDE